MITIENLSKKNKDNDNYILKDINFSIKRGEIFGICGKFGSGKSVLLRVLRGIEAHTGSIRINGSKISKELTSYFPQHYFGLYNDTVINNIIRKINSKETNDENVPLPIPTDDRYQQMKQSAIRILNNFHLKDLMDYNVKRLTTSEKQLLIFLKQFVLENTKLVILDEPWSMQHPILIQKILEYVKEVINTRDIAVIIVSSNIKALKYFCDNIGFLIDGRLEIKEDVINNFINQIPELFPFKPLEIPNSDDYETILKLENVSMGDLFKNFNLEIYEGEILGIIGDNKSGKTSLLKMISGHYIPDMGKILYLKNTEVNISEFGINSINALKSFGYISQEISNIAILSVKNFISLILKYKKPENIERVIQNSEKYGIKKEILDLVIRICISPWEIPVKKIENLGLSRDIIYELFTSDEIGEFKNDYYDIFNIFNISTDLLRKKMEQLSFVETKLIILITYLLIKPQILILDEFDADIDIITKREIVNYLLKINSQYKTTIIFSTHDPYFLKDLSHRALILDNGKIKEINDPETIFLKVKDLLEKSVNYLKD